MVSGLLSCFPAFQRYENLQALVEGGWLTNHAKNGNITRAFYEYLCMEHCNRRQFPSVFNYSHLYFQSNLQIIHTFKSIKDV